MIYILLKLLQKSTTFRILNKANKIIQIIPGKLLPFAITNDT